MIYTNDLLIEFCNDVLLHFCNILWSFTVECWHVVQCCVDMGTLDACLVCSVTFFPRKYLVTWLQIYLDSLDWDTEHTQCQLDPQQTSKTMLTQHPHQHISLHPHLLPHPHPHLHPLHIFIRITSWYTSSSTPSSASSTTPHPHPHLHPLHIFIIIYIFIRTLNGIFIRIPSSYISSYTSSSTPLLASSSAPHLHPHHILVHISIRVLIHIFIRIITT